jgi:hypothetical protein
MKRQTHRQKVIAIYPDAHLYNGYDVITRVVAAYGENGRPDLYSRIYLSIDRFTAKEAWKDAWKNVQVMMLEKFGS